MCLQSLVVRNECEMARKKVESKSMLQMGLTWPSLMLNMHETNFIQHPLLKNITFE